MSIHFQLISSSINGISADIISISAYRNAIPDYGKAAFVLFFVFHYVSLLAAGLHKKCKRHIPPIKKKAIKKNAPPLMGAPLCSYHARYANN